MLVSLELDVDKYAQNRSLVRAFFLDSKASVHQFNFTFKHEQKRCFKQSLFVKRSTRDKLAPIRCRLNVSLPSYETEWELMPMFNSAADSSKIHEVNLRV